MNKNNYASRRPEVVTPRTCPTCESAITEEQFDTIMHISAARQEQVASERATLQQEREAVAAQRSAIAADAAAAEREKWETETARGLREGEKTRKQAEAEQERVRRAHEKELQAETQKREAQEKRFTREVAAAQATAKRAAHEEEGRVINELQGQLKTLELRRRRDEDTLKKTITALQAKAARPDAAHFGPESEEALVEALRAQFPGDRIEHHGKAGDVVQVVLDGGRPVGKILYEVKNTGSWQREYLRQVRRAMEARGTAHGILVSRTLPSRGPGMCVMGGVIVALPSIATQIATVVRDGLITVARLQVTEGGKASKMAALYDYLRSDEFATAIQRVRERIEDLRDSLARERAHHDGWWSRREQLYAGILREATGIDARVQDLLGGGDVNPRAKALPLSATGST